MPSVYDLIVSLGGGCAVANQLRFRDMRPFALPLDFTFMVDELPIKYLQSAFVDNFKDFCLKENLVEFSGSERGDDKFGKMQYKDIFTGFRFIHHFPKPIEIPGAYEQVKEVIDKRINRLISKINKSKRILFILNTNFCFDINHAIELKNIIEKRWQGKKIHFLVIQFGAGETRVQNIKNFGKVFFYDRKMREDDFNLPTLPEWQFFNDIKLNRFESLFDKYKYKIWSHLGKELSKKGLIP